MLAVPLLVKGRVIGALSARVYDDPAGRLRMIGVTGTQGKTTTKVFEKPELFIKVKCDVHPWMFAYICVVDHPWFAVTDQKGNFTLPPGLPPAAMLSRQS